MSKPSYEPVEAFRSHNDSRYYFSLEISGSVRFFRVDARRGTSPTRLLEMPRYRSGTITWLQNVNTRYIPFEAGRFQKTMGVGAQENQALAALDQLMAIGQALRQHYGRGELLRNGPVTAVRPLMLEKLPEPQHLESTGVGTRTPTYRYQWGPLGVLFKRYSSQWDIVLGDTQFSWGDGTGHKPAASLEDVRRELARVSVSDPLALELEALLFQEILQAVGEGHYGG